MTTGDTKIADQERERCAAMLNLSRAEAQLMAGEMTAQEWRTLSAVLVSLQKRMHSPRSNVGFDHYFNRRKTCQE